jgi:hypothetical protein
MSMAVSRVLHRPGDKNYKEVESGKERSGPIFFTEILFFDFREESILRHHPLNFHGLGLENQEA